MYELRTLSFEMLIWKRPRKRNGVMYINNIQNFFRLTLEIIRQVEENLENRLSKHLLRVFMRCSP